MAELPNFDDEEVAATADLVGRSGASGLAVGYLDDDVPADQARWYATAQYRGARITEENHRGPVEAMQALAHRILSGATCAHCGHLVALSDVGAWLKIGAQMADGSVMTRQRARQMERQPLCRWRRVGPRWVRGCETTLPAPAARWWEPRRDGESTADYLGRVLDELGATDMAERARLAHFDDYFCPDHVDDGANINRLIAELDRWARSAARTGPRRRARAVIAAAQEGEFDGTSAEAQVWAAGPDGQAVQRELREQAQERRRS